ncbi:MAG: response regulator transcription factor [Peptostreptococcaceae bacterium]
MNILLAEDDQKISRLISDFLKINGYNVLVVDNGQKAIELFEDNDINLCILDVMMPFVDGWEVCKFVKKNSDVPVLMLTAKDKDVDELFGFDIGCDEYMSKPFNINLLLARVKNLTKRFESKSIKFNGIEIDKTSHIVKIDNEEINLTPKEFELLELFMENINNTFSRDYLLETVWGYDYEGDERTVDTHITRLRKKLQNKSEYLKTIRGYGYKLSI